MIKITQVGELPDWEWGEYAQRDKAYIWPGTQMWKVEDGDRPLLVFGGYRESLLGTALIWVLLTTAFRPLDARKLRPYFPRAFEVFPSIRAVVENRPAPMRFAAFMGLKSKGDCVYGT